MDGSGQARPVSLAVLRAALRHVNALSWWWDVSFTGLFVVAVGSGTDFSQGDSCLSDEGAGDGRPGRSVTRRKGFARRFIDRIDTRRLIGHGNRPYENSAGFSVNPEPIEPPASGIQRG